MDIVKKKPVINDAYTVAEIFGHMDIKEAPIFIFPLTNPLGEKVEAVVQDTHCERDDLKNVFKDANFVYARETSDRLPVFIYEGTEQDARKMLNVEVELDHQQSNFESVQLFITPKGFPRGQYFELTSNRTLSDPIGDEVGIPMKLQEAIDAQG